MPLLAQYRLHDHELTLSLIEIETGETVHTLDNTNTPEDQPLLLAAKAWAEEHGHSIATVDNNILR